MKYLLPLVLAFASLFASAQQIDVSNLSPEARAAIHVITTKEQATFTQKADEWLTIGERVGRGLAGAAKEVGIAVSDFAATPIGKVTMAIIVWKTIGKDLMHPLGAAIVLGVGLCGLRYVKRRIVSTTIDYHPEKRDIFQRAVKTKETTAKIDGEQAWGLFLAHVVVVGASLICLFTI